MIKWKLCRQRFGNEEYDIVEGTNLTIGRGFDNKIILPSIVVSRNHCVIKVQENEVTITDLKSSNGIYVGLKKIPPNVPKSLCNNDLIGIGWTFGAQTTNVKDNDKYVFKLVEQSQNIPIKNRIQFQSEEESNDSKISLKRKLSLVSKEESIDNEITETSLDKVDESKNVLPEINSASHLNGNSPVTKWRKCDNRKENVSDDVNVENNDLEYEAFSIKQEYLANDEPIQVDSDSDSEAENWMLRLSQSSPGKPFIKIARKEKETCPEETSYSQWDDDDVIITEEEVYSDDLITIPWDNTESSNCNKQIGDLESCNKQQLNENNIASTEECQDKVDSIVTEPCHIPTNIDLNLHRNDSSPKRVQVIEPLSHPSRKKSHSAGSKSKSKYKKESKSKCNKSISKHKISHTQKEERKKKLKELASKDKESVDFLTNSTNTLTKPVVSVKNTNSNRGAFLTNAVEASIKLKKRKESPKRTKNTKSVNTEENILSIEVNKNENKISVEEDKPSKIKESRKSKGRRKSSSKRQETEKPKESVTKKVVKLTDTDFLFSGKPISKVEPLPPKKKVRFSTTPPDVHEFQIEPGNQLKKTSTIKTTLVDIRQSPVFSLEKITLMKVLRWNPHWLTEQTSNPEPPPILGHQNTPMAILTSFNSHKQYVQLVGDLLLMEIWECLTQSFIRSANEKRLEMRIEHLPPLPQTERCYELFNLSVNISMPTSEAKSAVRTGEVLMVEFGPEEAKTCRFFFVHRKMRMLRNGQLLIATRLAYIQNELHLFESMEYLCGSPLCEAILKPEPKHFQINENNTLLKMNTQWTSTLNESQKRAVKLSVSAALNDRPFIQMVQGPPGTGKSSVICAIVMAYLYDTATRVRERGKLLICATRASGANEVEACGVCRLAAALSSLTTPRGLSLAIITPYAAHRDLIRNSHYKLFKINNY
ncbi:unnamed protein product [Leptidea sinapis]|uniref:FHA domain-containing protein n=1 Tax=Leptidea sinapis TaxID=189913 RepID=A0A5E4R0Y8_9NEOP|nr:unnamed protein product [Leptidea sinapis]